MDRKCQVLLVWRQQEGKFIKSKSATLKSIDWLTDTPYECCAVILTFILPVSNRYVDRLYTFKFTFRLTCIPHLQDSLQVAVTQMTSPLVHFPPSPEFFAALLQKSQSLCQKFHQHLLWVQTSVLMTMNPLSCLVPFFSRPFEAEKRYKYWGNNYRCKAKLQKDTIFWGWIRWLVSQGSCLKEVAWWLVSHSELLKNEADMQLTNRWLRSFLATDDLMAHISTMWRVALYSVSTWCSSTSIFKYIQIYLHIKKYIVDKSFDFQRCQGSQVVSKVVNGPRVGSGLGIDSLSWKLLSLNIYQQGKIRFRTFGATTPSHCPVFCSRCPVFCSYVLSGLKPSAAPCKPEEYPLHEKIKDCWTMSLVWTHSQLFEWVIARVQRRRLITVSKVLKQLKSWNFVR